MGYNGPSEAPPTFAPQPGPQTAFMATPADICIFGGQAFGGKALSLDTPIPTPSGWSTMGALQAGDRVFDERGKVCRVTAAHPVMVGNPCYRVTFEGGAEIIADAGHLWKTTTKAERDGRYFKTPEGRAARRASRPSRGKTGRVLEKPPLRELELLEPSTGTIRTTAEIAATIAKKHGVAVCEPLDLAHTDLPIPPYLVGAWLGDGTTTTGAITTADPELIEQIEGLGWKCVKQPSQPYGWRVVGLTAALRDAGLLGNKHVPPDYLRASAPQRLELLRGLMDTDGNCNPNGSVEYTGTLKVLVEGVAELATSLGYRPTVREGRATLKGVDHGPKYRLKWTPAERVFHLERKAVRQKTVRQRSRTKIRMIRSVEPIDSVPVRCIAVDSPSRLFLAGRAMIPTHNTYALLLDLARWHKLPNYKGVVFRRTGPQITQQGGLWDESQNIFPALGAVSKVSDLRYRFPSGGNVGMLTCQYARDALDFKGLQADVISFDQLEDFDAKSFFYLISRNRGSSGIRSYVRATANPQPGWLAEFLQFWWDPNTGYAIPERDGVLRWMVRLDDELYWGDSRQEMLDRWPDRDPEDIDPKSVTFIASTADDNPIGLAKNPGYKATINAMRHVDKERLGRGNWLIRDDDGAEFPAEYFLDLYADHWPEKFQMKQIAIDASEGGDKADFGAIIFGGLLNGVVYVDAKVARMPIPLLLDEAFEMGLEHRPEEVCFEGDQFQKLLVGAFQAMVSKRFAMPWNVGFTTTGGVNKRTRIRRLAYWFRDKKLKFRRGSPGVELLLEQTRTFGLPKVHDDGPDALEMMLRRMNERAFELYEENSGDAALSEGYDTEVTYR